MHAAWVYILTNEHNKVLYTGVTADLRTRVWEHRTKQNKNSFTSKYNVYKLVYFESFELITDAIARESYVKNQTRIWKLQLIRRSNPKLLELRTPESST
jgi:putative endonuclease